MVVNVPSRAVAGGSGRYSLVPGLVASGRAAVVEGATVGRLAGVDRLRGVAVLLMVLDHLAVVVGLGGAWRLGPTRLSLPLFAFAAAVVPRSWSRRTLIGYAVAVVAELVLNPVIGLGWPGPVALLLFALVVLDVPWRSSVVGRSGWLLLVMFGLLQALYWPVPWSGWTGYEPGLVVVWCGLGSIGGRRPVDGLGEWLPAWVGSVGRRAVWWYVGHLVVLTGFVLGVR